MILSDLSIKRPVICLVASILILLVGGLSFRNLPVREYPVTDPPVISVETSYPGASAEVVESKITEPLEKDLSAIDGIRFLRSNSQEGESRITLEFNLNRNLDEAANDVRDRVSRARNNLPQEARESQVSKVEADASPIMSVSFRSDTYSRLELYDFADRFAVQRFQTVPGVGSVVIRGPRYTMRLWVDSDRLAAYGLTVSDIESALRQQNVEIPGGRIESVSREFTVRVQGNLSETVDFENLVLATRGGYQIKFSDVGRVELGAGINDLRSESFFKAQSSVSVLIIRQSQANLLDVANAIKALVPSIQREMPEGVTLTVSYDTSVFVDRSVKEVYKTLVEATVLVVLVLFFFLRDWRATLIPLLAIPVSIVGAFAVMAWLNFTLNVLTLLALVLAVGLVVDDAIVMLENIYRRIEEGEKPIPAAVRGARQVAFAIIATTLTLAAVFVPVAFQSGQTGRLFYEFGFTLAIAVLVSAFVALTLTPMLCSRMLKTRRARDGSAEHGWLYRKTEPFFAWINRLYSRMLRGAMNGKAVVLVSALVFSCLGLWLYTKLQRELIPIEDRGIFSAQFIPPVGSTPTYVQVYSNEMERMILEIPEVDRTFRRTAPERAFIYVTLKPWEERTRKTQDLIAELRQKFSATITGGLAYPSPVRPIGSRRDASGLQIVLQGADFRTLQIAGARFLDEMRKSGIFLQPRLDPQPTKPQLAVRINRSLAADLKVPISEIAGTLESLLGGKRVTQFQRGNQQYDVVVRVEDDKRVTPSDLGKLYVRSRDGQLIQLASLVTTVEDVVPESYPHLNRLRSVTVSGQLATGKVMSDGIAFMQGIAKTILPTGYRYSWDGETRDFLDSASDTFMLFGLALVFTFLILAAQFESWIHPITIFTAIILAISGGLIVLYCTRFWGPAMTDNLFSRFGLIMLIGLVAKNGILIVEFANELQLHGKTAFDAAYEAASLRFRPIVMTSIATILGAVPIAFATGAGAETRNPMGLVIVGGLTLATAISLFVVPIAYVVTDRIVVRLTGHGSAQGLTKALEIERETSTAAHAAETAK